MHRVFVVEDDDDIREMLLYALNSAGFEAEGFERADLLFPALEKAPPALLLLDIMLPGADGLSILKSLRQTETHRNLAVIMLTAKGSEIDRIKGLDLGADDYITKPFSVMEVISRIRAVLRRTSSIGEGQDTLYCGNICLNTAKRQVRVAEQEISLTFKEFELLHYLMLNEGIVLSRDRILEQVWGFDFSGESRTVDMHIKSLRQKLGDSGSAIKTVRNVGYKIGA